MDINEIVIEYTEETKKQLLKISSPKEAIDFLKQYGFPITKSAAEDYYRRLSEGGVPLSIGINLTEEECEELFRIRSREEVYTFMEKHGFSFAQKAADELCGILSRFDSFIKESLPAYALSLYVNVICTETGMLVETVNTYGCAQKRLPEIYTIPTNPAGVFIDRFEQKKELKHVIIPEGVTKIPDGAFYGCSYLESVSLPPTVTSIGHLAFNDCFQLRNINISRNLTKIGYGSFRNCNLLQTEKLPEKLEEKRKREARYMSKLKSWVKNDRESERRLMELRPFDAFSVLQDLVSVLDIFCYIELASLNSNYSFVVDVIQAPNIESVLEIPEEEFETEINNFIKKLFFGGLVAGPSDYQIYAFSAKGIKAYVKDIMLDALRSIGARLYSGDVINDRDDFLRDFLEIQVGKQWYMIKMRNFN